jgi:hypothetical protein
MTQHPSPYQPPMQTSGYAPTSYSATNGPARQAGILMIILGALLLLMGGCVAGVGASLSKFIDKMPPEQVRMLQEFENSTHISAGKIFVGLGIFLIIVSILYMLLGIFVRGGGLGWTITSIVLTVLTILYLILNVIGSLFQGPGGFAGLCFGFLLLGLFGWLFVLLIQAARWGGKVRMGQSQYQQQMMLYQQAMQQYQQPGYGYGYGYPPPPAPPAPPPAPQDQPKPPSDAGV